MAERVAIIGGTGAIGLALASRLASAGCEVVIGPTLAGGWYLLALNPADPALVEAAADGRPGTAGRLLAAASTGGGIEVGLLRAERDLAVESDLRAAAADPLVDMEVARLLSGLSSGSPSSGAA